MRRLVTVTAILLCLVGSVLAAPATNAAASHVSEATYAHAAARYATRHGYSTGIAVLDTATGRFYGAGHYKRYYASESVVKVLIATEILLRGRMHGSTAKIAYKMITQSDDESADRLYGLAGGDSVINKIDSHYHVTVGSPPIRAGWWGNTHISARGLVRFYAKVRRDSRVWPWLYNAMRHATRRGSDGTFQYFGIPSASKQGFAIKQGWGYDDDCFCHASYNSTGFVDHGRYAIAILTAGPGRTFGNPISRMLSAEAKRLMPDGRIYDPREHNPEGALSYANMHGSMLHIGGWAIDPDRPAHRLHVGIYDGRTRIWYGLENHPSPTVNAKYHGRGDHGFRVTTLRLRNGRHHICVVFHNLGHGTTNPRHCTTVHVRYKRDVPAVFRPSNGTWYIHGVGTVQYGKRGDFPVPDDYRHHGQTNLAVFRPSTDAWYIRGVGGPIRYGGRGDEAVPADYDGDGRADVAVFRSSEGSWYVHRGGAHRYGSRGDIPVPGDYGGDGKADIAVFRPSNGTWHIRFVGTVRFGTAGDMPVPGDYDGDRKAEAAVFRPSIGTWYIHGGGKLRYGKPGDIPVPYLH